jgi:hypothetical protein
VNSQPLLDARTNLLGETPASHAGDVPHLHDRPLTAAVWVMSLVAAAPILWVHRFVSTRGPLSLLDAAVARQGTLAGAYLSQLGDHVSGTLAVRLLCMLGGRLGPEVAERLLVAACVALLAPSALFFLRRVNPAARIWALVVPCLALSWPLRAGAYGFALGLPMALAALGAFLPALPDPTPRALVGFAAALALLDLAQPMLVLIALGAALLYGLFVARSLTRLRVGTAVLLAATPALVLGGPEMIRALGTTGDWHADLPLNVFAGVPSHLAFTQTAVGMAVALVATLPLLTWTAAQVIAGSMARRPCALRLRLRRAHAWPGAVAIVAIATLLVPTSGRAFSDVVGRMPIVVVLLALGCAPMVKTTRWRRTLALGLVVLTGVIAWINLGELETRAALADEYDALGGAIPPGSTLLPLSFGRKSFVLADEPPALSSQWADLVTARGVLVPSSTIAVDGADDPHQRDEGLTAYRPPAGRERLVMVDEWYAIHAEWDSPACTSEPSLLSCQAERASRLRDLARYARAYDRVLVWTPPADFAALLQSRGFTVVARSAHGILYAPPRTSEVAP